MKKVERLKSQRRLKKIFIYYIKNKKFRVITLNFPLIFLCFSIFFPFYYIITKTLNVKVIDNYAYSRIRFLYHKYS